VDSSTVVFPDGIELIDGADAPVSQHQGTRLQHPLSARVAYRRRSEPGRRSAYTRRQDGTGRELRRVPQDLGLAGARIPHEEHVGFSAELHSVGVDVRHAADERQHHSQFHQVYARQRGAGHRYKLIPAL
jgi:hypothetical protein